MGFKEIALPLAARGLSITPVRPNSKAAFLPGFQNSATSDVKQILEWDAAYPDHNAACVAKANLDNFWFFEVDSPDVVQRIQTETGKEIPTTFRVRSRPGRGHFYWKQTPASIAMGNITQEGVKHADFSVRVKNEYVVAPGSIHPHSQMPYEALRDEPIAECPDWLITWILSQKVSKTQMEPKGEIQRDVHGLIPHGSIHGFMLREAGRLRALGLGADAIYPALSELVHKNCAPPINEEKIKTMAQSICNFPEGAPRELLLNQKDAQPTELEPPPTFDDAPYPQFPDWVMTGTSIYKNFVEPYCAINSRVPYFMWMPAMIMLLNYTTPKIRIKSIVGSRPAKGSIYTVIIGRYGETIKSSCVNDAKDYFNYMGCLVSHSRDLKAAEGRIVTSAVGSMESLGINMQKSNCKNAILIYDELSHLVSKAGIEQSSLSSHLLTAYEGNTFENGVKSAKETFSIQPPYCISLIACTTDGKFAELWSRLAGKDSGLDDRFTFILQPETPPKPKLWQPINFVAASLETRKLIDKAVNQGEFAYEDLSDPRLQALVAKSNRLAMRAEKWALALAIDLGLSEIDGECVERAVALVEYERAVKRYLKGYEASTRESEIQQEICRALELSKGRMAERDLQRKFHYGRKWGTSLWGQAYKGLFINGWIRREGAGTRSDPSILQLMIKRSEDDE